MHHLVLLFAAGALLCRCGCQSANINRNLRKFPVLSDVDNSIESHESAKRLGLKKFVRLTQRPPTTVRHAGGGGLDLTCEAVGSPAPSVQWFRNDVPIFEFDQESNELIDSSPTSIARVASTLIVKPSDNVENVYTCLVTAGQHAARASSTVYTIAKNPDFSERQRLFPFKPKVVVSYKVFMDIIGNNAVLPCRVKGHPRPKITWLDNNGVPIRRNPRMRVLRSGELVIRNLRWSDMGEFSCRANNLFGADSVKTFVYPVAG